VARALLAEAGEAAERLEAGADPEALHDLRVALRRLRTVLRAFRPWLGGVRRRDARRVAKLARATGAARDAEVQLGWLAAQRERLSRGRLPGLAWMVARLEARRPAAGGGYGREIARERRLARKLRRRLASRRTRRAGGETLGVALAAALRAERGALDERLGAIRGAADVEAVHQARIAAKRLRYLLEPLRGTPGLDATEAVDRLKRAQDLLGELHDAHVLGRELALALEDASVEQARRLAAAALGEAQGGPRAALRHGPRAGLLALVRLARARRDARFEELEAERARDAGALGAGVEVLAGALERRGRGASRSGAPRARPRAWRERRRTGGS